MWSFYSFFVISVTFITCSFTPIAPQLGHQWPKRMKGLFRQSWGELSTAFIQKFPKAGHLCTFYSRELTVGIQTKKSWLRESWKITWMSDTDKRANQAPLLIAAYLVGALGYSRWLLYLNSQGVLSSKNFSGTCFWKSIVGFVVKIWRI